MEKSIQKIPSEIAGIGMSLQQDGERCHNAVHDSGAGGHFGLGVFMSEDLRHVAMLCGVVGHVVHAEAPGSHVGEQGDQEHDADDGEQRRCFAHHGGNGENHAEVGVDLVGRDSRANAEAAEQVDGCNCQATHDDSLRNVAGGVFHGAGEGADNFEAHEVEQDDGQVGQSARIG